MTTTATKKPAAKKPAAKAAKPRLTAEERKAAKAAEAAAAETRRQAQWAEFEAKRPLLWVQMWAKAMRLYLLTKDMEDLQSTYSWWFDDFGVDAEDQQFRVEEMGGHYVSEASLHPGDVERINASLDRGLELLMEYREEQARLRREEEEKRQRRQAALDKLTDEDKKLLGLR